VEEITVATADETLLSLGLDPLLADRQFLRNVSTGILATHSGHRSVCADAALMGSLQSILNRERAGSWITAVKAMGHFCGKNFAVSLDARLAALGKPMLSALPLEVCLIFVESYFATRGLGHLKLDLGHAAEHGVVIARLENSFFAEATTERPGRADAMPAGLLQGFFEHISGQGLGCEEISCVAHGEKHCTFALTAPERLAAVLPFVTAESAEAIIKRLCT
jgi:predicted hydrocarbon binding protein